MHQFLDVVDADHETQEFSRPTGRYADDGTAGVVRRIDRKCRVDHVRSITAARARHFHARADGDIAALPGTLQQIRQLAGGIQVDTLPNAGAGARRGEQHRHRRAPLAP